MNSRPICLCSYYKFIPYPQIFSRTDLLSVAALCMFSNRAGRIGTFQISVQLQNQGYQIHPLKLLVSCFKNGPDFKGEQEYTTGCNTNGWRMILTDKQQIKGHTFTDRELHVKPQYLLDLHHSFLLHQYKVRRQRGHYYSNYGTCNIVQQRGVHQNQAGHYGMEVKLSYVLLNIESDRVVSLPFQLHKNNNRRLWQI